MRRALTSSHIGEVEGRGRSWNSFAPGTARCPGITAQIQYAANWAITEKNSPDPTWSDHTDTNPPPGALVFYGGGGGFGHVAVSIGGGQEIGTLGYVGQRLPVSQYPVVGYLSNPYLGWAPPYGG